MKSIMTCLKILQTNQEVDMLEKYLMKYVETFGENFPIYAFMATDDKYIIDTIKRCLDNKTPYVLEVEDDIYY